MTGAFAADLAAERARLRVVASGPAGAAASALADSRVDLLALIRDGIPERDLIPGMGGALVRGKRHHIAGEAKAGKTLSVAVVGALDIIAAGGIVTILDRENGAEEYARRLGLVLNARGADADLHELVKANYRYHAWPQLKLEHGRDQEYPAAFAGSDVVIFDSSRRHLTSVGLTEDSSDDYSAFTDALIDPLMLAGIATVILDNTGHNETGRARGSSAKADLADIMFSLKVVEKFGVSRPGRVELTATHSRIGEVDGTWQLELGAGEYGSWERRTADDVSHAFEHAVVAALTEEGTLGRDPLLKAVRARGVSANTKTLRKWLDELLGLPSSPVVHDPESGYQLTPGPNGGPGWARGGSGPLAPDPSLKGGRARPLAPAPGRGSSEDFDPDAEFERLTAEYPELASDDGAAA